MDVDRLVINGRWFLLFRLNINYIFLFVRKRIYFSDNHTGELCFSKVLSMKTKTLLKEPVKVFGSVYLESKAV